MRQLTALQALVNSRSIVEASGNSISPMLTQLQDEVEKAYDAVQNIRTQIESSVIADWLRDEGFPATESKGVKDAIRAAYAAMRTLDSEMLDLVQAVGMHEQEKNGESYDD